MQRQIPWVWIFAAFALLLLPTPAGRVLLDLIGGLTLLLLLLPLLLGGAAFIGWQILRRRLRTCEVCGTSSIGSDRCPACGAPFTATSSASAPPFSPGRTSQEVDASDVTITVDAVEVDNERD